MSNIELKDDMPAMSPQLGKEIMQKYQALCKAMLTKEDYQKVADKEYKKKSAWRKLARAFNVSDEIIQEVHEKLDEKGNFQWRVHVRAYTATGRQAVGVGVCSTRERAFAHVDHDVYATAHTRAKNRAISDLLGAGETSYEEMETPKTEVFKEFGKK